MKIPNQQAQLILKIVLVSILLSGLLLGSCQRLRMGTQPKPNSFQEQIKLDKDISYAGNPQGKSSYPHELVILKNEGFIIGYDQTRLNPAWVAYKLFAVEPGVKAPKRPGSFEVDPRLKVQVESDDYKFSGYDRGHMAPNYGIATRYGRDAQLQTFLTSNIAPQKHALNGGIWQKLEHIIADHYAQDFEEIWVVVGPIYEANKPAVFLSDGKIQIPDAFFMLVIDELQGKPRGLAFIFPQQIADDQTNYRKFLTSIDQVEAQTGLDFFQQLPDPAEEQFEKLKAKAIW
jgi:endonuclease G